MIFDNIKNRAFYKEENLAKVLEVMSIIDEDNFPNERIVIANNDVFINPVTLDCKNENDCIFEAHKKFIDVHYIVSGTEGINVSDIINLSGESDYNQDNDILFYSKGELSVSTILNAGDFLVCYPHDSHKVAIQCTKNPSVKKLVGKIRV